MSQVFAFLKENKPVLLYCWLCWDRCVHLAYPSVTQLVSTVVDRSIFVAGGSISTVERNISMTAYPPGRGISMVGRSVSIGAYPWEHILAGLYP